MLNPVFADMWAKICDRLNDEIMERVMMYLFPEPPGGWSA